MEAEAPDVLPQATECHGGQRLPRAGREPWGDFPLRPPGATNSADTLVLGFWSPDS